MSAIYFGENGMEPEGRTDTGGIIEVLVRCTG